MPVSTPRKKSNKSPTEETKNARSSYHHGNLREALIEATLTLVAELGPDNVSLREVAKRAGVSSGAPFRHFPNRTTLMTAVAEEAMHRLRTGVVAALETAAAEEPLTRLKVIGRAYLQWAVQNPAHFVVISNRRLIDFDGSASLRDDNAAIQEAMLLLLDEAERKGALRAGCRQSVPLHARALSYGLARMYIDGHMPQWGVQDADAMSAMESVLDQFINGVASEAWLKSKAGRKTR